VYALQWNMRPQFNTGVRGVESGELKRSRVGEMAFWKRLKMHGIEIPLPPSPGNFQALWNVGVARN